MNEDTVKYLRDALGAATVTVKCGACGATVPFGTEECPKCGEDLKNDFTPGLSNPSNDRLPLR